jgi:hypothetical protein
MTILKCPSCGEDAINVEAIIWVGVYPNDRTGCLEGIRESSDTSDFIFWNDSPANCSFCDWEGTLADAGGDLPTEAEGA